MTHQWVTADFPTISACDFRADFEDLLGGPPDPQKETAAPTANGNGGKKTLEAGQLQSENYQNGVSVPSGFTEMFADLLGSDSVLDQPIAITRFPTQSAQTKTERRLTLRDLADEISRASAHDKAGLPWFKLATFGDIRTEKNCLRNNANVIAVSGVEADYDAGQITPGEAEAKLRAAGVAALLYTSPSHGLEGKGNRWRVFAPFDRLLPPEEREKHMARLNGVFDGTLDGASFVRSQSYYGGNVEGRPPVEIRLVDGVAINTADALDATALAKNTRRDQAEESDGIDASGSGALYRLACKVKRDGGDKADFAAGIADNSEAAAHVAKEDQSGKGRGQRAIDRSWDRAPDPVSLENIFEDQPEEAPKTEKPGKTSKLTFLTPGQCVDSPSRGYLLKGLLAPRDVACIFGAPGAGKSLIAPYLGYAIARGDAAFGMRSKQGAVFYVAAEDPHGMRGRVSALKMTHGDADEFALVEGVSDLLAKDSPDLKALRQAVAERKPALIILDTLAMSFPGLEENSAEGMGRVVAVARTLTEHGAAVILIHHDTKAEGSTPRGHSLLNGALDVAMLVSRDEYGVVRGKLTKNRNGSCDRDIAYKIGVVDMGVDEDGDAITVPIAQELAPGSAPKLDRLTPAEQAALNILRDIATTVPDPSQGIPEEDWRKACVDSMAVSASENAGTRQKAIRRAILALVRKGRISNREGLVRLQDHVWSVEHQFEDCDDDLG